MDPLAASSGWCPSGRIPPGHCLQPKQGVLAVTGQEIYTANVILDDTSYYYSTPPL